MCEGSGSLREQLREIVTQPLSALAAFQLDLVQRQGELDHDLHSIASSDTELRAAVDVDELESLKAEQEALGFFLALAEQALKRKLVRFIKCLRAYKTHVNLSHAWLLTW